MLTLNEVGFKQQQFCYICITTESCRHCNSLHWYVWIQIQLLYLSRPKTLFSCVIQLMNYSKVKCVYQYFKGLYFLFYFNLSFFSMKVRTFRRIAILLFAPNISYDHLTLLIFTNYHAYLISTFNMVKNSVFTQKIKKNIA